MADRSRAARVHPRIQHVNPYHTSGPVEIKEARTGYPPLRQPGTGSGCPYPKVIPAVLRWPNAGRLSCDGAALNGEREFAKSRWKPVHRVDIHAEFVVASAEVLDEGMSRADDSC